MRVIRTILTIIIIILAIIVLIGNFDIRVLIPYLFTCIGILQIFNGIHFYKQGKKTDGLLLFLMGIFILGLVFKIVIELPKL
ncbi:hypothetical protein HMPREF1982_02542 [Clostridiales bacterium oral taxon 876 str. F0540]|nr:hypothetical protein HMPREF1982_02542 [Clostridiales bacterium oral taxon 876 str. F0540]